ncbi:methylmalonyl-CoA mutase small subunit [Parabacteroides sp. PF5-9]|uniref:methylmalonyl-CoA mutase small subunit n=1 Tax=Parabacteroides sp. PF5-9 TaxID=1742404 RepID=UPI002476B3B1|nr:methylmalonyl-CoA mutase small subunit [Parabacteroides sp. PF5-9]MDH6359099.1 methylmalonyl-CoA mutase [Parabacteroides sp. PF5-9]
MAELKEKLFSEFPSVSTEEWMAKITADLKGAPFEKKLVWRTSEGFNVNPFYRAEDIEGLKTTTSLPGEFPFVRGTKKENDWKVRQNMNVTDFKAANAKALDLLDKGVNSLGFHFKGEGVSVENIAVLLKGICPECVELNFKTCNGKAVQLIEILGEYVKKAGADVNKCFGSVNYNPFKKPLVKGKKADSWVEEATAIVKAGKILPGYRVLAVDACQLNDAGAYITQELGYALAWGNEIMAKLTEAGLSADEVAKTIKFNFGISANYFMEIAKFRAARWLWAEIVSAYKPECECACKMQAQAQTSEWNLTIYDAHANLLRTQTEAMSAAIAGVDSITVAPFDVTYETPDEFSERIARNQQLLLKEECHFDKVVDPSAGSYYIEVLTSSIADEAWKLFLEVEDKGGFYATVKSGEVQNNVNASAAARKKAIATRREILLGTNQYPNVTEVAAAKIKEGTDCGCGCSCEPEITALDFSRGASEFEALRLATEKRSKTPNVFMLTIGNLAMRLARSQFAGNFFGCAGYKIIDNLGFETVEAGVEAALKAEADIVVLCSSDDEYADFAPAAYKALSGKAELVVAGAPACMDDLKAQGITEFINVKSNVLETLKAFNAKLGIA